MKIPVSIKIDEAEVSPKDAAIAFVHGTDIEQAEFLTILGREANRMAGWDMQCRYISEALREVNSHGNGKIIAALETLLEHLKEEGV